MENLPSCSRRVVFWGRGGELPFPRGQLRLIIKQLSVMLKGLGISEPQVPPCGGDPREVMSLEQRPRDQDNSHIIPGLLSREVTGPQDLETA